MSAAKSRFGGIVDAARARTAEEPPAKAAPAEAAPASPRESNESAEPAEPARPARANAGKSSNPAYKQISAYVRKETHRAALRRLLDEDGGRDLSDVIEELLAGWAAGRP